MRSIFRRILVPCDFSAPALAALDVAVDLAAAHGGALTALHVVPPIFPAHGKPLAPLPEDLAAAERRLAGAIAKATKGRRLAGAKGKVVVGQPFVCILEAAKKADAIVIGTLGRTGLPRLLLGSVAERVVRQAPVPVLTVRGRERQKRGR